MLRIVRKSTLEDQEARIKELEKQVEEEKAKYKKYMKQVQKKSNSAAKKWLNGYPDE
jgi:hypothetical protein